jgi:hypothetical protein
LTRVRLDVGRVDLAVHRSDTGGLLRSRNTATDHDVGRRVAQPGPAVGRPGGDE